MSRKNLCYENELTVCCVQSHYSNKESTMTMLPNDKMHGWFKYFCPQSEQLKTELNKLTK